MATEKKPAKTPAKAASKTAAKAGTTAVSKPVAAKTATRAAATSAAKPAAKPAVKATVKTAVKASAKPAAKPKAAPRAATAATSKPTAKPAAKPAAKAPATKVKAARPESDKFKHVAIAVSVEDDTSASKEVQKLQRAIVDGLEDVKAQDIRVFNTLHLSSLFERVIIASGTSNRQTKALAASVRDAVREAGFAKPRIEGEDNGEWIIVDCGAAVAHIMQPAIRQYYTLEDIWGEKPVNMRIGKAPVKKKAAEAKPLSRTAAKTEAKKAKASESEPAKAVRRKVKAAS